MNKNIKSVFTSFFSELNGIVGSEKTFHALYYHHLLKGGYKPRQVAREYRLRKSPVDIVLFDTKAKGNFQAEHKLARAAIEFKGGAYGNRNALHDTINLTGHCSDIDKLRPFRNDGLECWFVCIDLAELGVSLDQKSRAQVANQCKKYDINFAYYCTAEEKYMISTSDGKTEYVKVVSSKAQKSTAANITSASTKKLLSYFKNNAHGIMGSEDDYTALLYEAFRQSGFSEKQLSLETYFSFATSPGSRMQWRPDITVFTTGVEGHFNLYRNGKKTNSNDGHKLKHMLCLIEVKGSHGFSKKSNGSIEKIYLEDIEKLNRWRKAVEKANKVLSISSKYKPSYIFVGIELRKVCLPAEVQKKIQSTAKSKGVDFHYIVI